MRTQITGDRDLFRDALQCVGKLNNVLYRRNYASIQGKTAKVIREYFSQNLRQVNPCVLIQHQLLGAQLSRLSKLEISTTVTGSYGWGNVSIPTQRGTIYVSLEDECVVKG